MAFEFIRITIFLVDSVITITNVSTAYLSGNFITFPAFKVSSAQFSKFSRNYPNDLMSSEPLILLL